MAVIVTDEDGKELATYKIIQGAPSEGDEGDTIKRGQRLAEWDPIPAHPDRSGRPGRFRGSDGGPVGQRADRRNDWHHPPRHHRLARASEGLKLEAALIIKDKKGKVHKLPRGGEARYLLSVEALLSVEPGRA